MRERSTANDMIMIPEILKCPMIENMSKWGEAAMLIYLFNRSVTNRTLYNYVIVRMLKEHNSHTGVFDPHFFLQISSFYFQKTFISINFF